MSTKPPLIVQPADKGAVARLFSRLDRQRGHEARLALWRTWDWTKQDVELAAATGYSRERIRHIRRLVGAPRSPAHRKSRQYRQVLQWVQENQDEVKGMSTAEVMRKYGIPPSKFRYTYGRILKPFLRNGLLDWKHPWDLMNFRLPSCDLDRIWRLPRNAASKFRYLKRLALPKWSVLDLNPQVGGHQRTRAYHLALKAEEHKAAKHFAQVALSNPDHPTLSGLRPRPPSRGLFTTATEAGSREVKRHCAHCGGAFKPTSGRHRYCRRKCYCDEIQKPRKAHYRAHRKQILEQQAAYRAANRERIAKRRAAHRVANRERILQFRRAYYRKNRDYIRKREAAYRAANRDKVRKRQTAYWAANRDKIRQRKAAYCAANRKRIARRHQAYYRKNRARILKRQAAWRAAKRQAMVGNTDPPATLP